MYRESEKRRAAWQLARLMDGTYYIYNGGSTNPAGAQCVNVPNAFRRMLSLPEIEGNAASWATYRDLMTENLGEIPLSALRAGDILVLRGPEYAEDGHVALVLNASQWPAVVLLEQNFPTGSPCHYGSRLLQAKPVVLRV